MERYRTRSIEKLFNDYVFENGRTCKEDADITKRNIARELHRRLEVAIKLLDDAKTEKDAKQIYEQFINH